MSIALKWPRCIQRMQEGLCFFFFFSNTVEAIAASTLAYAFYTVEGEGSPIGTSPEERELIGDDADVRK